MNRFQVWWVHFKIGVLGDKKFDKAGTGIIPCQRCGRMFRSYQRFGRDWGDYVYDNHCEWCSFADRNPKEVKREIQNLLLDYQQRKMTWGMTKAYLRAVGIEVEK